MQHLMMAVLAAVAVLTAAAENIVLTEDTEVNVPVGTTNEVEVLGGTGAFTLTKTGGGVLEVHWVENAAAKVVIAEGEFRVANPRPDAVFAKAYFHVDAADFSTMQIESENGTNFVTRWNDADGRGQYATVCMTAYKPYGWDYVLRTDPEKRKPFISAVKQNGLPVLDFGSLMTPFNTNRLGRTLGYGAAMSFDKTVPEDVAEAYTVASDTDDIAQWPTTEGVEWKKMYAMSHFSGENAEFAWRGMYATADRAPRYLTFHARNNDIIPSGNLFVDGVQITFTAYESPCPDPGFHLVKALITPRSGDTRNRKPDSFCAEKCFTADKTSAFAYGGQRIAEYAIFTNRLTEAEAAKMHRYLTQKWFARPMAVGGVTVANGARFSVEDKLVVRVADYRDESGADVELGSACKLTVGALHGLGALLHLDASDTNSMELVSEGGTNFVTRWSDADGSGRSALHSEYVGLYNQRADYDRRKPFLNPTLRQNGRTIVDLGSPIYSGYTDESGLAIGYGAAMDFPSLSFGQAILVVSDVEEVKTIPAGTVAKAGPSYLGSATVDSRGRENGAFVARRGALVSGKNPIPLLKPANAEVDANNLYNGALYLNDELVADKTKCYPPDGFYIIDMTPVEAVSVNRLGRATRMSGTPNPDTFGGIRYAEVLLLPSPLSTTVRDEVYDALRSKWYGEEVKHTRNYANLRVPETSTFSVDSENLSVVGTLSVGGRVAAPAVSVANLSALSCEANVVGLLTIGENAVLSFEQGEDGKMTTLAATSVALPAVATVRFTLADAKALKGRSIRIIASARTVGSVEGWSVEALGFKAGVKLSLKDDGLYADFPKAGLMLILR